MKSLRVASSALVLGALVFSLAGCGKVTDSVYPSITLDTTPPDAPTNVAGSYDAAASRDYLNWTPSTAADLAGYEVWQYSEDPTSGATGQMIASASASTSTLALPITSDGGTHWFRVRALDEAGNKSTYSATAAAELHAWDGSTPNPGSRGLDGGF